MTSRSFLDTNILVYTDDHSQPAKRSEAIDLVKRCRRARKAVLSSQVLQEYFVITTRKLRVSAEIAQRKVGVFSRWELIMVELPDILSAIELHRHHQLSFWDALLVRTAIRSSCSVLFTEDLQHGQRFGELEVVNPFL
jgi:predicted nucleic acid-binding protein